MFIETSAKAGYNVKQVWFRFHLTVSSRNLCYTMVSLCMHSFSDALPPHYRAWKPTRNHQKTVRLCQKIYYFLLTTFSPGFLVLFKLSLLHGAYFFLLSSDLTGSFSLSFFSPLFFCCCFLNSFFVLLVTEIDLNNPPVETKPAEGGCAC